MEKNRDTNRYGSQAGGRFGRSGKWAYRLCALLAFAAGACGIAYWNLRANGALYLQSDDGDLYISIARNLLETGHFIQTARPIANFVVPPGLPFVTTVFLFLFGNMSEFLVGSGFAEHILGTRADMLGVLGFQYAVYGAAAALMAVTALRLAENGVTAVQQGLFAWQQGAEPAEGLRQAQGTSNRLSRSKTQNALPWILAMVIGLAAPAFYLYCSIRIRHPNPGFVLTENYVVCLISLVVWLVVSGAAPRKILAATFVLMLFRPAYSLLFVGSLVWAVLHGIRLQAGAKEQRGQDQQGQKPVHRRLSHRTRAYLYNLLVMLVVFAAILGVNTAVNWIETGHAIVLEDYGNLDVYLANNEKAPADWYHSGKVPEFASARYNEIVSDPSLTRYEQNELAGQALHEYVAANTGTVVRNAGVKFYKLFFETWGVVWYAFLVCFALQMALKGLKWPNKAYLGASAVILSVLPAFGLLVARYSAPMLPLFIAFIVGTAGQAACAIATKPAIEKPVAEMVSEPAPVVSEKEEAVAEAKPEPIEEETTTEAKPTAVPEEKTEEPVAPVEVPVAPEAAPVEEPAPVEEKIEEPKAEEPHKPISLAEEIRTKSAHELAAELFPKKPKLNAPENSSEPPIAK